MLDNSESKIDVPAPIDVSSIDLLEGEALRQRVRDGLIGWFAEGHDYPWGPVGKPHEAPPAGHPVAESSWQSRPEVGRTLPPGPQLEAPAVEPGAAPAPKPLRIAMRADQDLASATGQQSAASTD